MSKVSIIMPVYNSEKYLGEAVQTILNQTLSDIEIILVNDKSTDNSGAVCDSLKKIDYRVRVKHLEENKGICGARNEGLKMAKGEYVAFCDNDDHFTHDLIEANYEIAKKYNAEMVKFGRVLVDIDNKGKVLRKKESPITEFRFFEGRKNMLDNFFDIKSTGVLTNVWNGLYKLSIIKEHDIWFDEEMRFGSEDADFSLRFFQVISNLAINPKSYYIHYRRDAFSTSRKFSMNKITSMIKAAKTESMIWGNLNETVENKTQIIIAKNNHVINTYLNQVLHSDSPLSYYEKINILKDMRNKEHLQYDLNKDIKKQIRRIKPKQWFFTQAYHQKKYHILHGILYLENKVKGEKW